MPQTFNQPSRENSEPCVIRNENRVNSTIVNYITNNEKLPTSDVVETSLENPSILFSDGHVAPSNIGESSALRFGTVTNPNKFQQLCSRSNTVFTEDVKPLINTSNETTLRNGETQFDHKPELLSKQAQVFPPQVENVKNNIEEMQNSVRNSDVRFGVNTRLDKNIWKK